MNRNTKKLNDDHRTFLVREFACFATPTEAADALSKEFGVEITPQSAQHYDATSSAGRRSSQKWQDLFTTCRDAFLRDVTDRIPEAHKAVRVQDLAKAARVFKKQENYMAMARMLEQIAKEVGNVHTNRRELTGKESGPVKYQDVDDMTSEQVDQELEEILARSGLSLVPRN